VSFQAVAFLLMPTEPGRRGLALEANERWQFEGMPPAAADLVVWGRAPWPSGTGLRTLARAALARERALTRLRAKPPVPWQVVAIHRWLPSDLVTKRARNKIRAAFLSGALVELASAGRPRRVIDAASLMAAGGATVDGFLPGSGGSALTRLRLADGTDGILRVARAGGPSDPAHAADALKRLALDRSGLVPRLLARGVTSGASWSLESSLRGRRPDRVTPPLGLALGRFCAALPRTEGPPTAHRDDLDRIAATFPLHQPVLRRLSCRLDAWLQPLPGVMRHGDLWSGNLLTEGSTLTGVVDWDGWHAAAAPGTDLLHLLGMEGALRSRRQVGELWLERPWNSQAFERLSDEYWRSLSVRPDAQTLEAVGIGWWAGQVAHSLSRDPSLARDRRWTGANVDAVLTALGPAVVP
jgi:hypothetical protein